MNELNKKLKKVPALNKQELLIYLSVQDPGIPIRLTTISGLSYTGIVVTVGTTTMEGDILTFELVNDRGISLENFLYLPAKHIESFEIFGTENALKVLSLGKVQSPLVYEVSGKLDVNRALKDFVEKIKEESKVDIETPEVDLPSDGYALNRIIKLTSIIQKTIIDVLKSEDARESWQQKYSRIAFINNKNFDVKRKDKVLQINFPFTDTETSEIQPEELSDKILSVL